MLDLGAGAMIEEILPRGVRAAESFTDLSGADLLPEEEACVARAIDARRREFATGRALARRALVALGGAPIAIPCGPEGAPCWPAGVTGSITHCRGYRAAAVAFTRETRALGIDAEPNEPLPEEVIEEVMSADERARLPSHWEEPCWDRLVFSAKEAVYKAWSTLTGCWLGFEDAEVRIDDRRGSFDVRLGVPLPGGEVGTAQGFAGRWLLRDGLLLTAVVVGARTRV